MSNIMVVKTIAVELPDQLRNVYFFSYFVSLVSLANCNGEILELLLNMADKDPSSYIRYCVKFDYIVIYTFTVSYFWSKINAV